MSTRDELERVAEYYDTHDFSEAVSRAQRAPSPAPGEPMVEVSLRLPEAILEQARTVATERGVKVRSLLREWVEAGLLEAEHPEQATVPVSVVRAAMAEYLSRQHGAEAS